MVSLNFQTFSEEQKTYRQKAERYKQMRKSNDTITVVANPVDLEEINATEEAKAKADKWHETLSTDLMLQEVLAILHDLEERKS